MQLEVFFQCNVYVIVFLKRLLTKYNEYIIKIEYRVHFFLFSLRVSLPVQIYQLGGNRTTVSRPWFCTAVALQTRTGSPALSCWWGPGPTPCQTWHTWTGHWREGRQRRRWTQFLSYGFCYLHFLYIMILKTALPIFFQKSIEKTFLSTHVNK